MLVEADCNHLEYALCRKDVSEDVIHNLDPIIFGLVGILVVVVGHVLLGQEDRVGNDAEDDEIFKPLPLHKPN